MVIMRAINLSQSLHPHPLICRQGFIGAWRLSERRLVS